MAGQQVAAASNDEPLFGACEHCGDPLERGVRYPVSVRDAGDDPVELFSFCGEACQAAWEGAGQ